MRRALCLAAFLCVASCSGGPVSPNTIQTTSDAMNIVPGPFLLTVKMATSGTSGFSDCVSMSGGGSSGIILVPPQPPGPGAPVVVSRTGNAIAVRPDDPLSTFRMDLRLDGAMISGVESGELQSGGTTVIAPGPESTMQPAVTGIVGPSSITGVLPGTVSNGSMTCTNNAHTWTLSPR